MPKIYSEEEKQEIKRRLIKAGEQGIQKYGVRKTTVDYLVKCAGIPKGTFYLFYESKELLLFQVIMEVHESIEGEFFEEVEKLGNNPTVDSLTEVFLKTFRLCENSCLLRVMTGDDMEVLSKKLPSSVLEQHFSYDDENIKHFVERFPNLQSEKIQAVSGAFRGLFLMLPYRRQFGENQFYESMRILVKGVLLQMWNGE